MQSVDMKRYKYLKYDNGKHFGERGGCVQGIEANSWTDWFVRCHNCFCLCDETDAGSDRFFSLRDVTSDIHANQYVYFVFTLFIIKKKKKKKSECEMCI